MFLLFIPNHHRNNEFTEFCQEIYNEAEIENENYYNGGNLNFIEILLKNKNNLTMTEIMDEVNTMILAVSIFRISNHCKNNQKNTKKIKKVLDNKIKNA